MIRLELKDFTVGYIDNPIIGSLNIEVQNGELLSLLGPSGAGKTTILKTIAGLLPPLSGQILINGQSVNKLPAEKRDVVLIFQKPLLFPFLNVGDNIGFGLRMQSVVRNKARKHITRILEITGLKGLENRKIHQLSGGQQQRVALARGLVLKPSILLLDEPFSNLDAELRIQMRDLLRSVQKETGTTMLFVTHDQSEAFSISDRIALLLGTTVRQTGTPAELFYTPADKEVACFFGSNNFLSGRIEKGIFHSKAGNVYINSDGEKSCPDTTDAAAVIRPEDIDISIEHSEHSLKGTITNSQFEGILTRLTLGTEAGFFTLVTMRPGFKVGQTVWLRFPPDRLHFF